MATRRTRKELLHRFQRQLRLLSKSANEYDRGDTDEESNMAIRLRVLFHDHNWTISVLEQLGAKSGLRLLSTAEHGTATEGFWSALTFQRIYSADDGMRGAFQPKLDAARHRRLVPFDQWWEGEIVYAAVATGIVISRRDVVLYAANKEGGAHVDTRVDSLLEWMLQGGTWMITNYPENGEPTSFPFENMLSAALRQITYEVLNSPGVIGLATGGSESS